MKILLVSQFFWPENFKINELCTELVKRGHEVTVITGKPNYPQGNFYKGFGLFSKVKSRYNGAIVYRLPIIPRGNGTGFKLSLNYLSFAIIGSVFSLFHSRRYDFSFVFAVSPITTALPAIVHRAVYGTKHYLWVLDLWPESAEVTGKVKFSILKKVLYSLVSFIYSKSDKIFISSQFMKKSILEKIESKQRISISYLPNWAEDSFSERNANRHKFSGIIPNGFKIMFAGNISYGQDIPSIIKTAQLLKKHNNIKFIILGDGSEKGYLLEKITEFDLSDTIFYLGSFPIEEMVNLYCHADMMLLTLRDELIYSNTVPGKLQGYLASKKPVAAMINGEAAVIINRSKCGIQVKAGDYKAFAEEILKMSEMPETYLHKLGQNGFCYYEKTFTKDRVISSFLESC